LRRLTQDNPSQQEPVAELERLVAERMKQLAEIIALRRKSPEQARARIIDAGEKRLMDAIREQLAVIQETERTIRSERQQRARNAYLVALTTGVIGAGFSLGLLAAFVSLLRRSLVARQQAANQAHEQREWFRTTLASMGDAVIATDAEGTITFVNSVAVALTGWPEAEAQGRSLEEVFRIVNEETRRVAENPARQALEKGQAVGLANHTVLIDRQGMEHAIDDSAAPIRDATGSIRGVVLIFRDIDERRRAERALARGEARYRALIEATAQMVWSACPDGQVTEHSPSWCAFTGQSAEEFRGQGWTNAVHPDDRPGTLVAWSQAVATRTPYVVEYRLRYHDGTYRNTIARGVPVLDNQGRALEWVGMNIEITEIRKAEEAVRRFAFLVENSTDFIGMCGLDFVPTFVNRAGLTLVGLDDFAHACRVTADDFFFPEDRARLHADFFPRVLRDGHAEIEIRFRHFKSGEAMWMTFNAMTLRDGRGDVIGYATISRNITAQKQTEEVLKESDRRKDEFLAMLAHELRNPLAPMRNALQILRLSGDRAESLAPVREMMERQMVQLVRLVDDLLDVSRISRGKIELRRERIEVAQVVNTALETSRPLLDAGRHRLTVNLPTQPLFVNGDLTRLAQVLSNLLNNAAKYTPEGGDVSLSVTAEDGDAVLRVRDNGIGIPADMLGSIFDLFTQVERSLHRAQGGLGIGLTLVRRLVELHGGQVEADSPGAGRGSEFAFRLPLAEAAPTQAAAPAIANEVPTSAARKVLVVDDNEDAALSLAMVLKLMGNDVCTAHDGVTALERAAQFLPAVVLLDLGLPAMDGFEVGRRLREIPGLANVIIIALTGWGQDEDRRRTDEAGFNDHLVKPVDPAHLQQLLATLNPTAA
jgi:PAS domain S-box-containing protein